jgi:hypothetical protein
MGGTRAALHEVVRRPLLSALVAFLTVAAAARGAAAADEAPRLRVPVSLFAGWDTPYGSAGLALGVETTAGWGIGAGMGFKDADPGGLHTLAGVHLRAPLVRHRAFDLAALLYLSRGDRERQRWHEGAPTPWLIRWEWRPAYRVDAAASARIRLGAFAVRLDAGVGYMLNAPRCEYIDNAVYLVGVDCADPGIPASENATSPWARIAPFIALAGEYDLAAASSPGAPTETEAETEPTPTDAAFDGRESNAWLAPTALTLGARTARVTLYEGIAPDLAVGLTDRVQASAGVAFVGSMGAWQTWLKVAAVKYGRVRLAVLGGGIGGWGQYDFAISLWGGGAATSMCLDEACRSLFSVAVVGGLYSTQGESSPVRRSAGAIVSPSLVVALGARAKLVAELHVLPREGTIAALMLRLPFRHLGLELGVLSADRYVLPAGSISWTF